MNHYLRLGLVPSYLVLCLLLGGASAAGYWANMGLQLVAIPIIVWAVAASPPQPMSTPARHLIGLLLLALLVVALQLVPLPPSLWTALPGRQPVIDGFRLVGQPLPWLPLSLDPYWTISSVLWLLPATAILLGIVRLGGFRASWLAWVIAAFTIVTVAVGALQIAGGPDSPWYIYEITNYGTTTGFFANANHMATLMVAAIPFLAALYLAAVAKGRSMQKSSGLFVVLAGTLVVILVGIVINTSLAGIGLSVPVLAASLLMILGRRRKLPKWTPAIVALLMLGSVATVFSAPFANNLTTQGEKSKEDSRYNSFTKSLAATADFMPLGSGIGTFQQIYRTHEDPAGVDRFYMNHVHGDYIEVALETGVPGLLVVALFLLWWARRCILVWRAEEPDYFARAATIASAAILAHSIVDYPLRTAAISAIFAMCCGLMAEPRARTRRSDAAEGKRGRHLAAD
ncbi:MAG TPA: O-antigen ligase family protein [Allosphingosinicella sp.]|nr:O-antigen ligase family protein [Allosphingosinicella sp.]